MHIMFIMYIMYSIYIAYTYITVNPKHTVVLFHRVQPQIDSPLCDCPHCSRTEVNHWIWSL